MKTILLATLFIAAADFNFGARSSAQGAQEPNVTSTVSPWQPLVNNGPLGAILLWFMFRNDSRQRAMEAEIGRLSSSLLLLVGSMPNLKDGVKDAAHNLKTEIDKAATRREKRIL